MSNLCADDKEYKRGSKNANLPFMLQKQIKQIKRESERERENKKKPSPLCH